MEHLHFDVGDWRVGRVQPTEKKAHQDKSKWRTQKDWVENTLLFKEKKKSKKLHRKLRSNQLNKVKYWDNLLSISSLHLEEIRSQPFVHKCLAWDMFSLCSVGLSTLCRECVLRPKAMFHILWKTEDWLPGIWIHYVQDVWSSGNSAGEKREIIGL